MKDFASWFLFTAMSRVSNKASFLSNKALYKGNTWRKTFTLRLYHSPVYAFDFIQETLTKCSENFCQKTCVCQPSKKSPFFLCPLILLYNSQKWKVSDAIRFHLKRIR